MILDQLVVSPFQSNCWIFGCDETREGVVIDPGDEAERILESVQNHGLTIKYLIHTHGHLDHVGATAAVQRETNGLTLIHEADQIMLDNLPAQAALFGGGDPEIPTVDQYIKEGDLISFGRYVLSVIETPGHSPGGICLKLEGKEQGVFAGDTLFQGQYRSNGFVGRLLRATIGLNPRPTLAARRRHASLPRSRTADNNRRRKAK